MPGAGSPTNFRLKRASQTFWTKLRAIWPKLYDTRRTENRDDEPSR